MEELAGAVSEAAQLDGTASAREKFDLRARALTEIAGMLEDVGLVGRIRFPGPFEDSKCARGFLARKNCVPRERQLTSWEFLKRRLHEWGLETAPGGLLPTRADCLCICNAGKNCSKS